MKKPNLKHRGFTLIELMIVVAIIGILAVVAVPKFAELIVKSKEASVKNSLGAIRSAVTIYYSDIGEYPTDLAQALTTSTHYYDSIPVINIPPSSTYGSPGHSQVTGVKNVTVVDDDVTTGVFAYSNQNEQGDVHINCTHVDSKNVVWSSY